MIFAAMLMVVSVAQAGQSAPSPDASTGVKPPSEAAGPAPPATPSEAVPPTRAQGNIVGLFSSADYPVAALIEREEGTVSFVAGVDPAGRVSDCMIAQGSGSASLDLATCTIVQRRARYAPARDARGQAVADRVTGRIKWVLPPAPPVPFTESHLAVIFIGGAAGELIKCRVSTNVVPPPPGSFCDHVLPVAQRMSQQSRGRLNLIGRELVMDEGLRIGAADSVRTTGRGVGENLTMLTAAALVIDANGQVARCEAADGNMNAQGVERLCKTAAKRSFVALDPARRDRSDRHAVHYIAIYTRPIG
jgi:TonB family protein